MKKNILTLLILLLFSLQLMSQSDYKPIECEGIIPDEFIALTSDKISRANERYQGRRQMEVSKRQFKRYNTESTFYVDYLLKNGLILFGTPMNDYVNRVGEYVLKYFPEVSDDIRFYIVKSPSVNAFTNEQGIVFINIGLIAQIENEAQLAFIMSHELIHYKYNHSFESYKEEIKAEANWEGYRHLSANSKSELLLKYSRGNERIADSLGFLEGYFNTDYSFDEVLNVFDVLLYSNLPFNEIEFDTTIFDDPNYKLDSRCILKEVAQISNPEDYDDHKLTHPNIKKRRMLMMDIITSYENPNTAKFIISESDFKKFQLEARFEMSNLYLSGMQYDKAFYNSYLLLRDYPNNDYLEKTMAYTLYAVAVQKKHGNLRKVVRSYKKVEGQSQRVNYLFKKIKTKELSALAVKQLWKYHKSHPDDEYMNKVLLSAIDFLIDENSLDYSSIYPPKKIIVDTASSNSLSVDSVIKFKKISKDEYEKLSKYDKIRYDKKYQRYYGSSREESKKIKNYNYLYTLTSETTDSEFEELYRNRQSRGEESVAEVSIDKFMLVNPLYYQIKNDNLIVIGTEQRELVYSQSIVNMAARRNIDASTLDILNIKADEVEKFNDLTLLNGWLQEYEDLAEIDDMKYVIPWLSNYTDEVRRKYNMRYIASSGLLEVGAVRSFNRRLGYLLKSVFFWQASPYFLTEMVANEHMIFQFFYCVDMETHQLILDESQSVEAKASQDFIDGMNYNIVYQLKNKK